MTKMSKKEQTEYLNPLIKSGRYSWAEIANRINNRLSKNISPSYCENWAHKIHLKNHFYGDGHDQLIYQQPRPIGSHKKCNGYDMIKCDDGEWRYTHRLIWQQEHVRIPDDKIVIFLDGDKNNLTLDNLMLINRSEHAILTIRSKRSANGEITKSNLLRMRLNHVIKKKHRCMMQARESNTEHIEVMKREAEIEADRERHGGKMTIDELVYKTLHEFD